MPSSVFFGMQHLNNNLLAAVSLTSINRGGEPIELCVLPLDQMLDVHPKLALFNMRMKPVYIHNLDKDYCAMTEQSIAQTMLGGYDSEKVADLLLDWFHGMDLPDNKRIIPLSHGWPEKRQVLLDWLGPQHFAMIFSEDYRDTLIATHFINDKLAVSSEPVMFSKQSLQWISKQLKCERLNIKSGNPSSDCWTIAQSYKRLLQVLS